VRLMVRMWQRNPLPFPSGSLVNTTVASVLITSFLLPAFLVSSAFAQTMVAQRYWITFSDRGEVPGRGTGSVDAYALGISDRALWRRAKVLPADRLIDELDLPVAPSYIDGVRRTGAVIRATSRWFNAVSAELSATQRATVQSLPFVASVSPVAVFRKNRPEVSLERHSTPLLKRQSTSALDYGSSLAQLNSIGVVEVHNRGINGSGVIVGMIDDGFNNLRSHPALKNIKVIAEYDFIQRDSSTSVAPGEYPGQGGHGAATLSAVGGFESGKLIGAAYGASFILAKSEIDSVEIRLEEDLYVEALEWMEQLGADVVSSSLGYIDWYTNSDLDGQTATTTKAARIAARKGILLVTAMGNEGNYRDPRTQSTGTMIAPADADSIVSVGAMSVDGMLASFSSTGPTADGRVKPEVVAPGVNVYAVAGASSYGYWNGTSLSTPLTAGVAALVLSANPDLTPMEVRARLTGTARQFKDGSPRTESYPNNFYGWGIVDAARAVVKPGPPEIPNQFVLRNSFPNPFNGTATIIVDAPSAQQIELAIFTVLGQKVRTLFKGYSAVGENRFFWRDGLDDAGVRVTSGVYICRLTAPNSIASTKLVFIK